MPGVCPACGIAYNKWQQTPEEAAGELPRALEEHELAELVEEPLQAERWYWRFFRYACFMPSDRHESAFWGHLLLYALFFIWGWCFILHGIDASVLGASVLHQISQPFHDYGHVMFRPFGSWWMYVGGSLFQIVLPLIPLLYFMVWQRDNFAASLMLWWSGQNMLDVSPWIADAPYRNLSPTSDSGASHDWWNLLRMSDALDMAQPLAVLCFALGTLVILSALLWGGFLLYVEMKGRIAVVADTD